MAIPQAAIDAIEQRYRVKFAPEETAGLRSCLDVHRLLLRKMGLVPGQSIGISACVFYRLREALTARPGQKCTRIRPSTKLGEVLPRWRRARAVRQLLGVAGLPATLPPVSQHSKNTADNWTVVLIVALMALVAVAIEAAGGPADAPAATWVIVGVLVGITYPFNRLLLHQCWLRDAHLDNRGTLRQLVAACVGSTGDRLTLYDRRVAIVWQDLVPAAAWFVGVAPEVVWANPALPLAYHVPERLANSRPETIAAAAFRSAPAIHRECLVQMLAALMRGEINCSAVYGMLYFARKSDDDEAGCLADALYHIAAVNRDYPIDVTEADWHYLRRVIAALRSELPLQTVDFPGCAETQTPPEAATEPFWSEGQWRRYEPLVAALELPEYDPAIHAPPPTTPAQRWFQPKGTPAGVYRTAMVVGRGTA